MRGVLNEERALNRKGFIRYGRGLVQQIMSPEAAKRAIFLAHYLRSRWKLASRQQPHGSALSLVQVGIDSTSLYRSQRLSEQPSIRLT